MTKVSEHIQIKGGADLAALILRRPDSIGRFPGVEHAYVGQPGLRMQMRIQPMGITLHDSVLLAWSKDRVDNDTHIYPFRIEGGRWLHGTGEMAFADAPADCTMATLSWEPEIPATLSVVPGMRRAIKRWLKRSSRDWLVAMKTQIEPRNESACGAFTLADVGA
ncbi:MAG: hypothetical protein ABR507_05175 [Actinomycetota bacterium]|nr:hypothetical protein [Actinomycetota bacterium]